MKLSMRWIFDHIDLGSLKLEDINIKELVDLFSLNSAEIESLDYVNTSLDRLTLAQVKSIDNMQAILYSPELKKEIILPLEKDILLNSVYLVKQDYKNFYRATLKDLGSSNTTLLPNVYVSDEDLSGNWKKNFEATDYIIEVSNTTITNRPDMWSHRGFAREFTVLLNKQLLPENKILSHRNIKNYSNLQVLKSNVESDNPFIIEIDSGNCAYACRRFAGLYFKEIENIPSLLNMATRLLRVNAKPINMIVDLTNYVMFDLSQPMHAFDAKKIESKRILARCAWDDEKIELLDNSEVILNSKDYVITDGEEPIALAGIMGGSSTAVSVKTDSIFLESANFDPVTIRQTSTRIKKRTEASSRFEKNLDPNQNTQAILRFLKLLDDNHVKYKASESIISLGNEYGEKVIKVDYKFILNKLGIEVSVERIEDILVNLDFGIKLEKDIKDNSIFFIITVPTFRSKDIAIKEDIVEEIARFIGYENFAPKLPLRATLPFDISNIMSIRTIKKHMAFGIKMNEAQSYSFFDEEFLKELNYEPKDYLEIQNPQSQNYKRLITSLVPNLFKCISTNIDKLSNLRFFELNRVWFIDNEHNNKQAVEFLELSGIFYDHKSQIDFYEHKALINSLFDLLNISIEWKKPDAESTLEPWYDINKTALLVYKDRIIGQAGDVDQIFLNKFVPGYAFIFELDANFLTNIKNQIYKFKPLIKYPEVHFDVSLLINQEVNVDSILKVIKNSNNKIHEVALIDMFHKEEWGKEKSLTFRLTIYDENKTLVKEEIDEVTFSVLSNLRALGAQIR